MIIFIYGWLYLLLTEENMTEYTLI